MSPTPGTNAELIAEVRTLSKAVQALNNTYLRKEDYVRRAKFLLVALVTEAVIIAFFIFALFHVVHDDHGQENQLVSKISTNCQARNNATEASSGLINGLIAILASPPPGVAINQHVENEYIAMLKHYESLQPKPVNCGIYSK